jgi:hypothetical protein
MNLPGRTAFIVLLLGLSSPFSFVSAAESSPDKNAAVSSAPTLNLDSLEGPQSQTIKSETGILHSSVIGGLTIALLMLGLLAVTYFGGARAKLVAPLIDLYSFPWSAKLTVTALLFYYGLTHIIAAVTVYLNTRVIYPSAKEYFFYIKPVRLSGLSHAHLMGMATMTFLPALFYSLSRMKTGWSSMVVAAAFLGILGDIGAWWLIKYGGDGFEIVSILSGILLSGGFAVMACVVFRDLWFKRSQAAGANS